MVSTRSQRPRLYTGLGPRTRTVRASYKSSDHCKRHRLPDRKNKGITVTSYRRRKP